MERWVAGSAVPQPGFKSSCRGSHQAAVGKVAGCGEQGIYAARWLGRLSTRIGPSLTSSPLDAALGCGSNASRQALWCSPRAAGRRW